MNRDFVEMLSALSAAGVKFLIVGAHALAAHGAPRATGDLDIWVQATAENAARVLTALRQFGAPLLDLSEADLCAEDTVFQIGVPPSRIDIAHGERTDNLGASIGVGRALTETVDASLTYFTSTSGRGPASGSFAATFRETLGSRLTLVQIATHASGQTSLKFGGSFLSNPVAVGIDYQTVYAPFRVGNPFVQAITLNVRVLIRNVPLQVATFTTPTGRTRYMVSGSQSWYRSPGGSGSAPDTIRFARYLIQGRVIEENGRPVPGAVLRISGEFVLTDSAGQDGCQGVKRGEHGRGPVGRRVAALGTSMIIRSRWPRPAVPSERNLTRCSSAWRAILTGGA
ncbi:MAG: hypothetical protein H0X67_04710 [Acidobacteria bacterium]|nr:hypothetical protein [Acidobacteriota bacterium]